MATQTMDVEPVQTVNAIDAAIAELKLMAGHSHEANVLAGRLLHFKMREVCTQTVAQFLDAFSSVLDEGLCAFIGNYSQSLDEMVQRYVSGGFAAVKENGYLAAARFYDTYVLRNDVKYESVPHMFMRISAFCAYHCIQNECLFKTLKHMELDRGNVVENAMDLITYFFEMIASQQVCCATPVMRSAGLRDANLSSCFIFAPALDSEEKTVDAVFSELTKLLACKSGVGMDLSTYSHGKNLHAVLKALDGQITYFNDHNIRPVSVAAYMEIWHTNIMDFLTAKLPENPERCGNLFQGVCIPEIFFRTYKNDPESNWYLFDPKKAEVLTNTYGYMFSIAYAGLVEQGAYEAVVPIKSVMFALVSCIIKTGGPYILNKKAINRHDWHEWSTHQYRAINCANLCAEVIQYPGENVSTCNLANICLPKCLEDDKFVSGKSCLLTYEREFSIERLERATEAAVFIINACIHGGTLPTQRARRGQSDRSMGIGVQGLADTFAMMGLGYFDAGSEILDQKIAETLYFNALNTSINLVKIGKGEPYANYEQSKHSIGVLHWHDWDMCSPMVYTRDEWEDLARSCEVHGVYNSQFVAYMPTAGTGQITGYSDSFYPFYSSMSSKVSNKEEILRPNMTLMSRMSDSEVQTLRECNWDIAKLPEPLLQKYRIFLSAFDYEPSLYVRRAMLRAPFIDQSQSMTLFLNEDYASSASNIKNLLMYGWECGLKTLMYYCRIRKTATSNEFECVRRNSQQKYVNCADGEGAGGEEPSENCIKAEGATCSLSVGASCLHCQ
ncbi:ribonucleotide reductase large [Murine herpesvirus strain 4556]|uniref:ribonucleoside-diphosphate reductase n=1 Tax=Murine herpesvirus TaxID=1431748 RepID=A0A6M4EG35_9BETA|nr:ribonucleotide reductase large [Murine herpesvirus]QJQ80319.1 ribonucleotide reductase large [Murine herpesvirus]UNZ86690.1 ribonucleotide reductase large [Murine herpesvirus strain 72]UNZ86767.1 ribonucleotide reductase large [Murine herpesvirus strain 4556]